ncbi:hypothetical protein EV182_005495, partial [Spiromyces aspiralis]
MGKHKGVYIEDYDSDSSIEAGSDTEANPINAYEELSSLGVSANDLQELDELMHGRPKRKRMTKEQRMLGVWADSDDSDDDYRGGKAYRSIDSAIKGTSFVKANQGAMMPDQQRAKDPDVSQLDERDEDARLEATLYALRSDNDGMLDRISSKSSIPPAQKAPSGKEQPQEYTTQKPPTRAASGRQTPRVAPDRNFAKFAMEGKGAAWKMMVKMGYKAGLGLGKNAEGIVNPIETKMRPSKMGIAYRGFKEKTPRVEETERIRNRDTPSSLETSDKEQESDEEAMSGHAVVAGGGGLKQRQRKPKPRIEYRTIEELMANVDS